MKRIFGCLALLMGGALLVWVGYNLVAEQTPGPRGNALPSLSLASLMILCGIRWVRGGQATRSASESEPVSASEPPHANQADIALNPLDRIRSFDLGRLNWLGWLLLFATFGFIVVGSILVGSFLRIERPDKGWAPKVIVMTTILLGTGFFFGVRWLLGKIGITIYRR
jgi:hypothetical protein